MKCPRSIRKELFGYYYRLENFSVEYAEHDIRPHSSSTADEERWLAYQQLWLFCMRYFPEMGTILPRKEAKRAKPSPRTPSDARWQQLGDLAVRVGFHTPEAVRLQGEDPCLLLAIQFLESSKSGMQDLRQNDVQTVANIIRHVSMRRGVVVRACFTTAADGPGLLPRDRRQERPYEESYMNDQSILSLSFLYCDLPSLRGRDITSPFVNRDFVFHFVGFYDQVGHLKSHHFHSVMIFTRTYRIFSTRQSIQIQSTTIQT